MKINGIFAWVTAAAVVAGMGSAIMACNDSVASPVDNNLLTNPGRAKTVMTSFKGLLSPRKMSDAAIPIRELLDGQAPGIGVDTVKKVDSVAFHEKIPTYSRHFNMAHDGVFTYYTDGNGTQWWHIGSGSWATYYSPDPTQIGPGEQFHEEAGPNATSWVPMWHITNGPYQTMYFDPTDTGSVWKHDGITTTYIPVGGKHIETGPSATFYEAAPIDTAAIPADLKNQFR
ncbi:MAG: hypothetical protein JST22_06050 [Bacteroidetes bacterium]|nr:hypothetical protein [Bacteroidota bacterium]